MTYGRLTMLTVVILVLALLLSPCLAAAEPYGAVFVGAALSHDTDIDEKLFPVTFKDVELNTSVVFGGKAGYFFDTPVLGGNTGLELEVYHFRPDIDRQTVKVSGNGFTTRGRLIPFDLHVTAVGLNGLYRFPLLRSSDYPSGP